jgi:hypothetical protein
MIHRFARRATLPLVALLLASCASTVNIHAGPPRLDMSPQALLQQNQAVVRLPLASLTGQLERTSPMQTKAVDSAANIGNHQIHRIRFVVDGSRTFDVYLPYAEYSNHQPEQANNASTRTDQWVWAGPIFGWQWQSDPSGYYDKVNGTPPAGAAAGANAYVISREGNADWWSSGWWTNGVPIVVPATAGSVGVITAIGLDNTGSPIAGARVQGYYTAAAGQNVTLNLNWRRSAAANIIERLRAKAANAADPDQAKATALLALLPARLTDLQAKLDTITGFVPGAAPYEDNNLTFPAGKHPSLLQTDLYATDLLAAVPGAPTDGDLAAAIAGLADHFVAPVTLNAGVLRLVDVDGTPLPGITVDLFVGDPSSPALYSVVTEPDGTINQQIANITPKDAPALLSAGATATDYTIRARIRNNVWYGYGWWGSYNWWQAIGKVTLDTTAVPTTAGGAEVAFTLDVQDPDRAATKVDYQENFRNAGGSEFPTDAEYDKVNDWKEWFDNVKPANLKSKATNGTATVDLSDLGLPNGATFTLLGKTVTVDNVGNTDELIVHTNGMIEIPDGGPSEGNANFGDPMGIYNEFKLRPVIAPLWASLLMNSSNDEGLYVTAEDLDGAAGADSLVATWIARPTGTADPATLRFQAILRFNNHAIRQADTRRYRQPDMVQFNYRNGASSINSIATTPYLIGVSKGDNATFRMNSGSGFESNGTQKTAWQGKSYPPVFDRQPTFLGVPFGVRGDGWNNQGTSRSIYMIP